MDRTRFLCPQCSTRSLAITMRLELLSDYRWDDIVLQVIACDRCAFSGIAVYEESRRGALDSEAVDHYGYRVSAHDLNALTNAIRQCPEPDNRRCECDAHRRLGSQDEQGRWNGLDGIRREGAFWMDLLLDGI